MTAALKDEPGHPHRIAVNATGLLGDFNRAGILTAADIHVARRLGALGGEPDEAVHLAVALVVRSVRHGSVVLDLASAAGTISPDDEDEAEEPLEPAVTLTWPEPGEWAKRCAVSPLIGGPLRMTGSSLWLARYWEQEQTVAAELLLRGADRPADLDEEVLRAGLQRLFPQAEYADQQLAAAVCALSRVGVLAGGPGTGKTTTVSRLLALLREQHPEYRIALAAPTGKAAARLHEAVRSSTADLPPADQARLGADLFATTLHRLLGWRPDARSRFRHDRTNRLPFEVVIVDESSMVSLTLMARLLEALRPATRLILIGDPDQLASVEAGAVLGDLVDRSRLNHRTEDFSAVLQRVLPQNQPGEPVPDTPTARFRNGVSTLLSTRRFAAGGDIAALAAAIRDGEADRAVDVLHSASEAVEFVELADQERPGPHQLEPIRAEVRAGAAQVMAAAAAGDGVAALAGLEQHRLLCTHRRGPRGVQLWSDLAAGWIFEDHPVVPRSDGRYAGEPLLITTNDYESGLYNGDTGVVVSNQDGSLTAVFGRGGDPIPVPLARLGAVRPLYAMTVHRSQGSQFDRVSVLLPAAASSLCTRETLYTAVTRARRHVRVIGSVEALRTAIARPAARATGLRGRLSPGA
ncbi:RecBCD enzyme subunit RecD [Kineosporia sp. NBRC 101677]|uniref:exodeoxyribonuclease V subunit alpha n=1 Tax=Kineosporia sp. NBRC 101677 TaxID=3032197 RepID=UPI0024A5C7CA|nr:exodeoxyribonuclease V subunit alpha [Kineosporia sp. NBRC 101677]GLY14411.1 RecBCD enzyme subunit RecD [Kineosporia sp. NBRC 101677]